MYSTNNISEQLLRWFQKSKRPMPWRKTHDPYKIWLSETMLQQTQVKTVIPFYNKWVKKYPNFESVASADLDALLKMWEGLGYYNRCRNFHKAVKLIVHDFGSSLPIDVQEFKALPGVGDYTAAAVYSIVLSHPIPTIDGNVNRVMSRLLRIRHLTSCNKKRILSKLKIWIDKAQPGDFNQAMMELGSTVCLPKNPKCEICPLILSCVGFNSGKPESYPSPKPQKSVPWRNVLTGVIWNDDSFLILQRKGYSHLSHLWELPGGKTTEKNGHHSQLTELLKDKYQLTVSVKNKIGEIQHRYSHFGITLSGFNCKLLNGESPHGNQPFRWIKKNEINRFAFPKANHKLFAMMKEN
ncbi:MAG: A/G-specific adenine glycosylase [Candidatus Marinimicrobia bacterium]|jgi:A/G-specific adenine glycosylase|nr:A/G-specific adenine glycosylase [Candidatus Neomarinimicrobiota bacterium]